MAKLNGYVHVVNDTGLYQTFGPDDDVPAWAQKVITNPDAWAIAPAAEEPTPVPEPTPEPTPAPAPAPTRAPRRATKKVAV